MYRGMTVSVVLPCHNEAQGLRALGPAIPPYVDQLIVVDNHSTDDTANVAARLGAMVVRESRSGYGAAIQAGLAAATGDAIAILDGDNSYPIEDVQPLLDLLLDGPHDVVSGCRYPLTRPDAQPRLNVLCNALMSWLTRRLFGIRLRDSQSGLMVLTRRAAAQLPVRNPGMGFSQELKIRAWMMPGLRCGERHITYRPREGVVKFRKLYDSARNVADLLWLWGMRHGAAASAVGIVLVGAAVRLYQYALNRSLWADEAALAVNIMQRSYGALWHALDEGQFATIGFVLLEKCVTTWFGASEYALRALPLVCGIAAIAVVYRLAQRTLGTATALVATALLAASPVLITYSVQVKEYSCDVLMSALACWALLRAAATPPTARHVLLYGALSVWILVKTTFLLVAFAISLTAIAFFRHQPRQALRWLPVYAAWIVSVLWFRHAFWGHYSPGYIAHCVNDFSAGLISFPSTVQNVLDGARVAATGANFLLGGPAWLVPSLAIWGAFTLLMNRRESGIIWIAPIASAVLIALGWSYPLKGRLILFLAPSAAVLTAYGLTDLVQRTLRRSRLGGIAAAGVLASLYIGGLAGQWPYRGVPVEQARPVMRYVVARQHPEDVLLVYEYGRAAFRYYTAGHALPERLQWLTRSSRTLANTTDTYLGELDAVRGNPRVWIVLTHIRPSHEAFIRSHLQDIGGRRLEGIRDVGASATLYDLSRTEPSGE